MEIFIIKININFITITKYILVPKKVDYYCYSFEDFEGEKEIRYENIPDLCDKFKVKNFNSFEKIKFNNVKFIKDNSEIIAIYNKNKFKFDEIINIVKKNVEILDISTDDADLEDVFLEVTNN